MAKTKKAIHEAPLRRLRALVTEQVPAPQPPGVRDAAFERLQRRLQTGVPPWPRWRLALIPLGVACAALALFLWRPAASGGLTYTVAGAEGANTSFVAAPAHQSAVVVFSDGSQLALSPSSRGRVMNTNTRGARVTLESGRARVHVVPRENNDWAFDAGPCLVKVTGTKFEMEWSASKQILQVWLESGGVTVHGPSAPDGVEVRAGQHLTMEIGTSTVRLNPIDPSPTAVPKANGEAIIDETPLESPPPESHQGQNMPATRKWARNGPPWATRVANGDFGGVLQEAERLGLQWTMQAAQLGDLVALADAARFDQQPELSHRVLKAVRQRFPATAAAHKAAFLLGRLAEESAHDLKAAIAWYDNYLSAVRDPQGGPYEAEALGRKMTATAQLHGQARARPIAELYLRRFPHGAYADAARVILDAR